MRILIFLSAIIVLSCQPKVQRQEDRSNPNSKSDLELAAEKDSISNVVWEIVEKRNSTWVENDREGHMSLYHPEFKRWMVYKKELMDKEMFESFWDGIKENEKVLKIEVEQEEMQILQGGTLAIAHYTIHEDYQWISEDHTRASGEQIKKGQVLHGKLRFSDVFLREGDEWLYVGGHRDGGQIE